MLGMTAKLPRAEGPAETWGETLIEIRDLHISYRTAGGTVAAVEGFSLDVGKGEIVSIVGPSGCGKTTILRCIAGLLRPDSGSISVDGRECTAPGPDRGMVFQDFALLPWRSVLGNVELGMEIAGVPREERRARAMEQIGAVGLGRFAGARVDELSGGMRQRAGLARALAVRPAVLLLDEPFGALDAQTRGIMQGLLAGLVRRSGSTAVLVTHSVDEALRLSDRVAVLTRRPASVHRVIGVPRAGPGDPPSPGHAGLRKEILAYLEGQNVMDG